MTARLAPLGVLLFALVLAACASSSDSREGAPADATTEAVTGAGSAVEPRAAPAPTGAGAERAEAESGSAVVSGGMDAATPRRSGGMEFLSISPEHDEALPRWDPDPAPGLLTAGDVDDHLNFDFFLGWLDRTLGGYRQSAMDPLDLSDRVTVLVTDRSGEPVSGARVRIEADGGRRAGGLVTQTGTDGRLELFPRYDFGRGVRALDLTVSRPDGGYPETTTVRLRGWDGERTVRVQLDTEAPRRTRALDVAFAIDVTGSMGDELRYLSAEFRAIVERIEQRYPDVDLRFGLVAYRDHGDQFVVRNYDFTPRVTTMQGHLANLRAQGGGDYPEAMDEALDAALALDWRPDATRLLFLVADAPPPDTRLGDMMEHVRLARASGIRMYPLAASGVGETAEVIMRTAAALTQGRYLFLTDDSGIGNPHAEPKVPCYVVTQLNDLLVRVIASELEGRRVEPRRDEVIREVGDYDAGVCEVRPIAQRPTPRRGQTRSGLGGYTD
ncbi:MAG: vWA domain-containing protein [Bacteroidota bacterium]